MFAGDISNAGALPALVALTNARFHLKDNVNVLVAADMTATWAALPMGEQLLPVPDAANNTEQKRTRMVMPIPHPYAAIILEVYTNGILTWRWMHEHVSVPILADPAQAAPYKTLVDYITIPSTMHPGVGGGPVRSHRSYHYPHLTGFGSSSSMQIFTRASRTSWDWGTAKFVE